MKNKLKKIKAKDLFGFFILLLALIPSIFVRIKNRKNHIWLVCELENTARDNGYHFFKYVRTNYPQINCYYAINKNCKDYQKIKNLGNVIQFGSFKHWVYYLSSRYNISSHKEGNPNHLVFTLVHLYMHLLNNRVFLQHGITKDDAPMFYYKNTYFKYFICGAKREYEYINKNFGYSKENVVYTGLARFDNLHSNEINKKKILLIPTWRRWFELSNNDEIFTNSEYFIKWNNFLNNETLINYLEKNSVELVFYPHFAMKKFIKNFNVNSKNITIVKEDNVDIQDLLKECSLMITDYSSVYMDFAYMKKPVIYYQFDYEEYRKSHFSKGYFDYKNDGFGEIINDEDDCVKKIMFYCNNGYEIEEKYLNRMRNFFELCDQKNCERIFEILYKGD